MPRRFCIHLTDGQPCGTVFDGDTERCPPHQAQADARTQARRGNTTQRGYGTQHQQLRARLLAQWTPGDPCARCGNPSASAALAASLASATVSDRAAPANPAKPPGHGRPPQPPRTTARSARLP